MVRIQFATNLGWDVKSKFMEKPQPFQTSLVLAK